MTFRINFDVAESIFGLIINIQLSLSSDLEHFSIERNFETSIEALLVLSLLEPRFKVKVHSSSLLDANKTVCGLLLFTTKKSV